MHAALQLNKVSLTG